MKLALTLSTVAHLVVIATWQPNINFSDIGVAHLGQSVLQSDLLKISLKEAVIPQNAAHIEAINNSVAAENAIVSTGLGKALPSSNALNLTQAETEVESAADDVEPAYLNSYLNPNSVGMTALPLAGIHIKLESQHPVVLSQISIRIYVDKNGIVKKTSQLNKIETDSTLFREELLNQIDEQLRKTVFIPAKKDGLAVNSYIEITFAL